jgi:hypothetical protein
LLRYNQGPVSLQVRACFAASEGLFRRQQGRVSLSAEATHRLALSEATHRLALKAEATHSLALYQRPASHRAETEGLHRLTL